MIYWVTHFLTRILSGLFFPCIYIGREHIPKTGSFIFASNHISNLDPVLIGICTSRRISFMGKDTLFKNPVLGFFLRCLETFPIHREGSDIKAIRETLRRIKRGFPIVIFPEGTRKIKGETRAIHEGIGLIVRKGEVPVVPIFIEDSDKALPPGEKFFKRHLVKMYFGKPVTFSPEESYLQIAERIMREIQSLPGRYQHR